MTQATSDLAPGVLIVTPSTEMIKIPNPNEENREIPNIDGLKKNRFQYAFSFHNPVAAREKFGWWGTDLKSDVINPIFVYFLNIWTAI